MVQNEIKIAIIMPIFQPPHVVDRALHMMNIQTKRDNIVVYLISDCSPYNYTNLINKYKETLSIVYLEAPENQGPGCARNRALAVCPEKYVLFNDDDDWLYDEYVIENYINAIQDIGHNFKSIYGKRKILWNHDEETAQIDPNIDHLLGTVFNKDYLDKHNIRFNEVVSRNHEDYVFFMQVLFFEDEEFKDNIFRNFISYTHCNGDDNFSICTYIDRYYSPRQTILEVVTYILAQIEMVKFYIQEYQNPKSKRLIYRILKYFYEESNTLLRFIELVTIKGLTQEELDTLYENWKFLLDLIQKNKDSVSKFPEIDSYAFAKKTIPMDFDDFYNSFEERFHNLYYLK